MVAVAPRRSAAGLWSRYATAHSIVPDIFEEPLAFAVKVGELAAAHGSPVIYPGTEEAITSLFRHRSALGPGARLPYPGPEPLARLRDKRTLPKLAAEAGLRAPASLFEGPAGEVPVPNLSLPCVLKPFESGGALGSSVVARNAQHLRSLLRPLPPSEGVLIQEYVRGAFVSLDLVVDREGQLVGRFQHVVRRTSFPEGGSVTHSISVPPDENLAARAADMLARAGYWGMADLQFLGDGGSPALIDVNPRFFGPLPLSLKCGINLPAAWHAVTIGEDPGKPQSYPVGVNYRRAEAEIGAALRGKPGRLLRRGPRPRAGSFWAPDDPVPSLLLTAEALAKRTRRHLGSLAERRSR